MRLRPEQLGAHLEEGLARAYLISGDEPLLVLEAADRVRTAARAAGIDERQVFHGGRDFDFQSLLTESASLSLFASRRLLDLRLPEPKPGRDGSQVLQELLAGESEDVLLITTGKIDKRSMNAAWVKAIDAAGVVIQCWPVRTADLPGWLAARMRALGLQPEPDAARRLADRVEGNLLAAVQEIEKLRLLKGPAQVTSADIEELVADSARFEVFLMVDAALEGNPDRALRMAERLRQEDFPLPVVSVVLTREIRRLARLREILDAGGNLQSEFRKAGVWESKKVLLQRAMRRLPGSAWLTLLRRCATLDRAIKGLEPRDPWELAQRLLYAMARGA